MPAGAGTGYTKFFSKDELDVLSYWIACGAPTDSTVCDTVDFMWDEMSQCLSSNEKGVCSEVYSDESACGGHGDCTETGETCIPFKHDDIHTIIVNSELISCAAGGVCDVCATANIRRSHASANRGRYLAGYDNTGASQTNPDAFWIDPIRYMNFNCSTPEACSDTGKTVNETGADIFADALLNCLTNAQGTVSLPYYNCNF